MFGDFYGLTAVADNGHPDKSSLRNTRDVLIDTVRYYNIFKRIDGHDDRTASGYPIPVSRARGL